MFHWSPLGDIQEWKPIGDWNRAFSEQDKIQCINLFFFFKNKGFKENISEIFAHMVLFKQKYGLQYSIEQEDQLREALKPTLFAGEKH